MRSKDWRGDEWRWGKDKAEKIRADDMASDHMDAPLTFFEQEQAAREFGEKYLRPVFEARAARFDAEMMRLYSEATKAKPKDA